MQLGRFSDCFLPRCVRMDFFPRTCLDCTQVFCPEHLQSHACQNGPNLERDRDESFYSYEYEIVGDINRISFVSDGPIDIMPMNRIPIDAMPVDFSPADLIALSPRLQDPELSTQLSIDESELEIPEPQPVENQQSRAEDKRTKPLKKGFFSRIGAKLGFSKK